MKRLSVVAMVLLPLVAQADPASDNATYMKLVGTWNCVFKNGAQSVESFGSTNEFESRTDGSHYKGTARVEDGTLIREFSNVGSSFKSKNADYVEFKDAAASQVSFEGVYGVTNCTRGS